MLIRIGNIIIPIQNISNLEKLERTVKAELEELVTEKFWRFSFIDGTHVNFKGTDVPLIDCWVELMGKSGRIMDLEVLYEQKNQISQNIDNILGNSGLSGAETVSQKRSVNDGFAELKERLRQKKMENKLREDIDNE